MRAFVACIVLVVCVACLTAMAFGEEPEIILEETPRIVIPPITFEEFQDEPEIVLEEPPEEEIAERLAGLAGLEGIVDVGEWDDDCRINADDGEILKCRLTW